MHRLKRIFLLLSLFYCHAVMAGAGITYEFSGGRFGDNVLAYLHAKWLALKYEIPLIYKPFPYSSELVLDAKEIQLSQFPHSRVIQLKKNGIKEPIRGAPIVFECPYFPEIQWELNKQEYMTFPINWKDPRFRKIANEMVAPKREMDFTYPPDDVLSIAIHVREGGGYDDDEHPLNHPLKSPPLNFYVDSLTQIWDLIKDKPIYCHIFTDAMYPDEIVYRMKRMLPPHISIDFQYREYDNHHTKNVLEDFFSLFNFDILIRPESNYSIVPALIHDYAIVCYPFEFSKKNRVVKIEEIKIEINEALLKKTLEAL